MCFNPGFLSMCIVSNWNFLPWMDICHHHRSVGPEKRYIFTSQRGVASAGRGGFLQEWLYGGFLSIECISIMFGAVEGLLGGLFRAEGR